MKQKKLLQNELLGTTQSNNNSNVVVQSNNGSLIYKVQKYYDSEHQTVVDDYFKMVFAEYVMNNVDYKPAYENFIKLNNQI